MLGILSSVCRGEPDAGVTVPEVAPRAIAGPTRSSSACVALASSAVRWAGGDRDRGPSLVSAPPSRLACLRRDAATGERAHR